jgi:protein-tyrosine phosphatase
VAPWKSLTARYNRHIIGAESDCMPPPLNAKRMPKSVLFVCSNNRFRSVAAEYLFRKMLQERDERLAQDIEVSSAGIVTEKVLQLAKEGGWPPPRPYSGEAPAKIVLNAMLQRGIDVSGHRSRELNRDTVERAALVITIDEYQKEGILSLYPSARGKVFTLSEFVGKCSYPDAEGPVMQFPPEHVDTFISQIEECLTQGMNKFLHYLQKVE